MASKRVELTRQESHHKEVRGTGKRGTDLGLIDIA